MKITLATKITIARIILIFPTVAMYIVSQTVNVAYTALTIVAAVLLALCLATDIVDGIVARKTHTVSNLGKFLDPLADKVAIVVILFLIVSFNKGLNEVFPYNGLIIAILAGIITSRELIIGIFRAVAASRNVVLAADIFGKVKTVLLDIAVVALVLAPLHVAVGWIATIVYYVGAGLTVFSGVNYMLKNKHVLHDTHSEQVDESKENSADEG